MDPRTSYKIVRFLDFDFAFVSYENELLASC